MFVNYVSLLFIQVSLSQSNPSSQMGDVSNYVFLFPFLGLILLFSQI